MSHVKAIAISALTTALIVAVIFRVPSVKSIVVGS